MKANLENIQKIYLEVPNTWVVDGIRIDNYGQSLEHFSHGWRNVVMPEITDVQKLGDNYVLINDIVTKEIINLTLEEIREKTVPQSISRMKLSIELLKNNISFQDIIDSINSIPTVMFSELDKKIAIVKFDQAVSFDRRNADLNLVATLAGISQEQLDTIFINGNA